MYSPYLYKLLIVNIFYLTSDTWIVIMGTNETAPAETKVQMRMNRLTKFTVIANSYILESEGLLYP